MRSLGGIISFQPLCVAPDYTQYSLRFGLSYIFWRTFPLNPAFYI
nr:MAG TPA: hypothetical protein [Caudoviricetes sp.]